MQANVPGVKLTSPLPCPSFRTLFAAHDPRWFLTRQKIWFSGGDLAGRMIVIRYNHRQCYIEGYQVVATCKPTTYQQCEELHEHVRIHSFQPSVSLHLDTPILRLGPNIPNALTRTPLGEVSPASTSSHSNPNPNPQPGSASSSSCSRLQVETPMIFDSGRGNPSIRGRVILSKPLSPDEADARANMLYPYGNLWPPPDVPARHRITNEASLATLLPDVAGRFTSLHGVDARLPPEIADKPTSRSEISDSVFKIRTWLEVQGRGEGATSALDGGLVRLLRAMRPQPEEGGVLETRMADEVHPYSTLDPRFYTPTPEKPYRGIWIGDYAQNGYEFVLIHQPDDEGAAFDPESIIRWDSETDEEFRRRKHDETVYRGPLEAIKLTGDPNVPRGEYTFGASDLGEAGFIRELQEPPFTGARVVKSMGHFADVGFRDGKSSSFPCHLFTRSDPCFESVADEYLPTQLILISHDRLAQYWVDYDHVSFFERVDIDKLVQQE